MSLARDSFHLRIAAGGGLAHFVPIGNHRAACGYMPEDSPGSSMFRARWLYIVREGSCPRSICRKCIDSQRPAVRCSQSEAKNG